MKTQQGKGGRKLRGFFLCVFVLFCIVTQTVKEAFSEKVLFERKCGEVGEQTTWLSGRAFQEKGAAEETGGDQWAEQNEEGGRVVENEV